jgi:hypothetical protein
MHVKTDRWARWLATTVWLVVALGCGSRPATGSAQLFGSIQQAASAADITRVVVTVSAPDISTRSEELVKTGGGWGGIIGEIPEGSSRTFSAEAFDASGTKRLAGQVSGVTITAGQTTVVALTLLEVNPPAPFDNTVPCIDSLTASAGAVVPGGSISLQAVVHDNDPGDTLTHAWTASAGSFSAPSSLSTTWTAPMATGPVTLTFTVTDSKGATASLSLTLQVQPGSGSASVSITFNTSPAISLVTASPAHVKVGEPTTVTATAADGEGNSLSYAWTAGCAGSWTDASSATARFTPSAQPAGDVCGNCPLTVTVTDGRGGQTTGTLRICVGTRPLPSVPPFLVSTYQSTATVPASGGVTFRVTAGDSQGGTLGFAWTASTGTLGTPASSATQSEVQWTPPPCLPGGAAPAITVTVTNAQGLSIAKTFTLSGGTACAPAGWSEVGPMASARTYHTATLLPSGQVLVAGGVGGGATLASAELYDPATRAWTPTAPMSSLRYGHTALLLPSGKVLVAGGANGQHIALSTAELYDPATGTWTATGSMLSPRYSHVMELLPSGKVLVASGYIDGIGPIATAEVYDPATGTWTATGAMAHPRYVAASAVLGSGKVLVTAGLGGNYLDNAEVYDPASGTWSPGGTLSVRRIFNTTTTLPSGKVLSVGGTTGVGVAGAELYDPATNTWSPAGAMLLPRQRHAATLLSSGKVLVTGGGYGDGADITGGAELYDPVTNTWTAAGAMSWARYHHTATLLGSGSVLVTGGNANGHGATHASANLYGP